MAALPAVSIKKHRKSNGVCELPSVAATEAGGDSPTCIDAARRAAMLADARSTDCGHALLWLRALSASYAVARPDDLSSSDPPVLFELR